MYSACRLYNRFVGTRKRPRDAEMEDSSPSAEKPKKRKKVKRVKKAKTKPKGTQKEQNEPNAEKPMLKRSTLTNSASGSAAHGEGDIAVSSSSSPLSSQKVRERLANSEDNGGNNTPLLKTPLLPTMKENEMVLQNQPNSQKPLHERACQTKSASGSAANGTGEAIVSSSSSSLSSSSSPLPSQKVHERLANSEENGGNNTPPSMTSVPPMMKENEMGLAASLPKSAPENKADKMGSSTHESDKQTDEDADNAGSRSDTSTDSSISNEPLRPGGKSEDSAISLLTSDEDSSAESDSDSGFDQLG